MKEDTVRRKTFAAREDLIDQLSKLAKQKGFSMYDYVNSLLRASIQAEEDGVNLQILIEKRDLLNKAKKAGFVPCPERLWYDMIELGCSCNKNEAIGRWYEAGTWLAKRYASSGAVDPLMAFKTDFEDFVWNSSPITIERTPEELLVTVSGLRFSENHTMLYGKFLEGALNVFGYNVTENDIATGNIHLKAIRGGK